MLRPLAIVLISFGFLGLLTSATQADTLVLQNGAEITPLPSQYSDSYRYYGCQDALIDPAQPLANYGRVLEQNLVGGSDRRLLVQFRNLHRAVGPGKEISAAYLVLHVDTDTWTTGNAISVYRLLRPWRQGSMSTTPQPQHWTSSWNYALYSADPNEAIAWDAAGASSAGVDRATAASAMTTTAAAYNPTAGTWRIGGLTSDVATFYETQAENFGWIIEYTEPTAATGQNVLHASESANIDLRPELVVVYADDTDPPARDVDLSVAYIARTPEYYRYEPVYNYLWFHNEYVGLLKNPGYENTQKWPNNGDVVTFTAHVQNKGLTLSSGPFAYHWKINGEVVATGVESTGIAPGGEATYDFNWIWNANDYANDTDMHCKSLDHRDRVVTFEVDTAAAIAEQCENNNSLTDFIEAPCMGFYVEQSFYDQFNETMNAVGSYSFEDWIQWHVRIWNDVFMEMSRYAGFAEDGVVERVRVQKIEVVADGVLSDGNHVPNGVTNFQIDGEWGFLTSSASQDYIDHFSKIIEWGLLHECTHQLGMVDIYTMNMESGTPSTPLKVQVRDGGDYYITRGYYPSHGGLMGGGDTRYDADYEGSGLLAGHTVGGLNSGCGCRRGYYGEYLYDIPQTVRIRILDATGDPLPNAELKLWQSSGGTIRDWLSWQPVHEGTADASGVFTLPNMDTVEDGPFTTHTGHTLHDNPWGRVNVVGSHGVFMIKVTAHGQTDYRWLMLPEVNRAYWLGNHDEYTFDIRAEIAPTSIDWTNIALSGTASSNIGGDVQYAVDGDVDTRWDAGNAAAGTYLQVDLGEPQPVAQVVLLQNTYNSDFFAQFHIETSLTGDFAGEELLFAREQLSWARASGDRRDMDPLNETCSWVTYAGAPAQARYVRVTADEGHWTKLAELIVYPAEETCFGDLDGDLDVDLADLVQLLSNYGDTTGASYTDGDLDADGDVDLADLVSLLSAYGSTCH